MRSFNNFLNLSYYDTEKDDCYMEALEKWCHNNRKIWTGGKRSKYLDVSSAFDIESSSFYRDEKKKDKVALAYHWQYGLMDDSTEEIYCITGRTWDSYKRLVKGIENVMVGDIGDGKKVQYYFPIFVHNLSFEMAFLAGEIEFSEVFAVKSATPLYIRSGCIEYRCSYLLSGMALKDLPTKKWKKIEDGLDYDLIRTPETPLTDEEMAYNISDVLTLCDYIKLKREEDGSVGEMQYTKTGYARKHMREKCMGTEFISNKRSNYINENLSPLAFSSVAEMIVQQGAYQGGHTACNPYYMGMIIGG